MLSWQLQQTGDQMAPWRDFNATVPVTEVNTNGQLFTKTAAEAPVLIKQWRWCLPG